MEPKVKSFWERKEGTTGIIILACMVGGGLIGLHTLLPTLILLAQNTLYFGFLLGALGIVTYLLLDPRFRRMIGSLYVIAMRALTKLVVEIDPIAIIENYIEEMKKKRKNMEDQVKRLRGQIVDLQRVIDENHKQKEQSLKIAQRAKDSGQNDLVTLKARKAGRLHDSNITLAELARKLNLLLQVLQKMYSSTEYVIEDIQSEVDVKKRERQALQAGTSALRSAMSIIRGDGDAKYMFDQAMDVMVEDISSKLGEMEHFMEVSSTFMRTLDLKNGIFEEDGLRQLEDWSKGPSFLLGSDKTMILD